MNSDKPSVSGVSLIERHIQDYGESLIWTVIDTEDKVASVYTTIKAYMPDSLIPYVMINSATKSLERVSVYDSEKHRLLSLYFPPNPAGHIV